MYNTVVPMFTSRDQIHTMPFILETHLIIIIRHLKLQNKLIKGDK